MLHHLLHILDAHVQQVGQGHRTAKLRAATKYGPGAQGLGQEARALQQAHSHSGSSK